MDFLQKIMTTREFLAEDHDNPLISCRRACQPRQTAVPGLDHRKTYFNKELLCFEKLNFHFCLEVNVECLDVLTNVFLNIC